MQSVFYYASNKNTWQTQAARTIRENTTLFLTQFCKISMTSSPVYLMIEIPVLGSNHPIYFMPKHADFTHPNFSHPNPTQTRVSHHTLNIHVCSDMCGQYSPQSTRPHILGTEILIPWALILRVD